MSVTRFFFLLQLLVLNFNTRRIAVITRRHGNLRAALGTTPVTGAMSISAGDNEGSGTSGGARAADTTPRVRTTAWPAPSDPAQSAGDVQATLAAHAVPASPARAVVMTRVPVADMLPGLAAPPAEVGGI